MFKIKEKGSVDCAAFYWAEPDTTMFKLKVERSPVSWATCKVMVAGSVAPGAKVEPSLFQVKVRTELAEAGVHDEAAILKVACVLPVFLM
jgi:hypothetical protein